MTERLHKISKDALPDLSDEALLQQLVNRDEQAFAQLLTRHLENVRGLAWRILTNHADVDEIAQDVFLKIWHNPQRFIPGKAKFSTWLYRVTLNACIDRQRKKKPLNVQHLDETITDTAPNPEKAATNKDRARRVLAAINRLPDRQRQAIALSHFQGVGNIETAQIMDTTVEAVESLLGRARRQLKKDLQKDIDELLQDTGG